MKKYTLIFTVMLFSVSLSGLYATGKSNFISNNFKKTLSADGTEVVSSKKQQEEDEKARKKLLKLQKEEEEKAKKAQQEELKKAEEAAKQAEKNRLAEEAAAAKVAEKARKEEERIAAEAAAKAAKEAKINFAGFGETAEKSAFEATFGIIKFNVVPNRGTFNISVMHEDGKSTPVFTTANEFNTTSFYLRKDNRIIKLNQDLGLRRTARKTENGVQIAYQLDNLAYILIDFTCFNSVENGDIDTVKITATVKSLYSKKAFFDLKFVMDTILGETSQNHFYRYDDTPIKQELVVHSKGELPWFVSKNTKGNVQFLFNGFDTTPITQICLGNFATVESKQWEPNLKSFRTFDTVLAYNNSAVGVIWNKHRISTDEQFSEVFYLSFSSSAKTPTGDVFIDANSEDKLVTDGVFARDGSFVASKPVEKAPEEVKTEVVISYEIPGDKAKPIETNIGSGIKSSNKTGRLKSVQSTGGKLVVDSNSSSGSIPAAKPVSKEQLTPEYIQKLLDRIAEIESSKESPDREELLKLNAELDAILEYLRK